MHELTEAIGRLDFAAFQWLRTHRWPWLDPLMAGLSDVGTANAIWIFLALLIAFVQRTRWAAAVQVILAVVITGQITDHVAKPLFNRQRPFESYAETIVYGHRPASRSFPSGHAAGAIAGAYTLSRLAPESRAIFWTLAVLVAFSRVYLGVHYPGDIVAGALLGFLIAKFVVGGTRWKFQQALVEQKSRR